MIIGWLFLAFFVLLGLSMPIGIAILVVCVGYILLTGGMQASFFIPCVLLRAGQLPRYWRFPSMLSPAIS